MLRCAEKFVLVTRFSYAVAVVLIKNATFVRLQRYGAATLRSAALLHYVYPYDIKYTFVGEIEMSPLTRSIYFADC